MNIFKNADICPLADGQPGQEDLELIAQLMKAMPKPEDIYVFQLMLCDDQVDRDMERFDISALEKLGLLFVGKPGIFDHNWSAHQQVARIYKTQVRPTDGGNGLFAWAYMLRGGENDELIRSIEGGIHREVSISCAVGARRCSVCGTEYGLCAHQKGGEYDGQLCHVVLAEPTDAYEWSFVAVPAQRSAGVVKNYGGDIVDIRKFVQASGKSELLEQLDALEKQAQLGNSYLQALKDEVVRLGGLADCGVSAAVLRSMTDKLDEEELLSLKKAYRQKVREKYPMSSQLAMAGERCGSGEKNYEYQV